MSTLRWLFAIPFLSSLCNIVVITNNNCMIINKPGVVFLFCNIGIHVNNTISSSSELYDF